MVVEGIPYKVVGGVNFYSRKEVKDILAYLKTIENGTDEVALRRIINVPKRGIGDASLEKIADFAEMRDWSLYDAMSVVEDIPSLGRTAGKVREFVNLIDVLRSSVQSFGISKLIREVIDRIGYEAYLNDSSDEQAEDRLENIEELISKAVTYEETHDGVNLSEFLEEVALVADIDSVNSDDNYVLLMTLHSAKGLEFPYVYLAGMEDGLFPSYMTISADDPVELEEERRLAYVGITRAMTELTITCAKSRMIRGEAQYNPISRFVREIPENLLDGELVYRRQPDRLRELRDSEKDFNIPGLGREINDFRPKAIVRPTVKAKPDKPFIANQISDINKMAGIKKGIGAVDVQEPDYKVGDRVSHIKYGEGIVLAMTKEPRDYKVTVNFDLAGQKIMYANFAKLKRV